MFIVIEGVPGCGKSTFIKQSGRDTIKYMEDIPKSSLVRYLKNINDPVETMLFQKLVYSRKLVNMYEASNTNNISLVDSGLLGDSCFVEKHIMNKNLDHREWSTFLKSFDDIRKNIKNHKIIYLSCKPETALDRCTQRSRDGESAYNIEYYRLMCKLYDDTFLNNKNVYVLNWNKDMTMKSIARMVKISILKCCFKQRIVFEGNIGAGKTSFIRAFFRYMKDLGLSALFVQESQDGLSNFIDNITDKNVVFEYQKHKLNERLAAITRQTDYDFVLYDRSLLSDLVFSEIYIEKGDIPIDDWLSFTKGKRASLNDHDVTIVYINTDHQKCMERCIKRNGVDSNAYDVEYLRLIQEKYDRHIKDYKYYQVKFDRDMSDSEIYTMINNRSISIFEAF